MRAAAAQVPDRIYRAALTLAWMIGDVRTESELVQAACETMSTAVGAEYTAFNRVDLSAGTAQADMLPRFELPSEPDLASAISNHPATRAITSADGGCRPLLLRDLVDWPTFRATPTYETLLGTRGVEHQLLIPVRVHSARRAGLVYTFNRLRGQCFTETDLAAAYLLQGVLAAHHALRAASHHATGTGTTGLTRRENDILHLLSEGLTAAAMGRALRISPRTVQVHIGNIYTKLGVHDRLQAALWFLEREERSNPPSAAGLSEP
ncbi:hypothetical protein GCM10009836_17980 [Pseudonocardia ailaonensis]|uniref:HTH luxR-type domain-containing protein n=1 Tax=Pseudonocardia ailaonensis TaxID=367279 RepID=A0ABN2MUN2_9PSEU